MSPPSSERLEGGQGAMVRGGGGPLGERFSCCYFPQGPPGVGVAPECCVAPRS